jgi:hypothetical protein
MTSRLLILFRSPRYSLLTCSFYLDRAVPAAGVGLNYQGFRQGPSSCWPEYYDQVHCTAGLELCFEAIPAELSLVTLDLYFHPEASCVAESQTPSLHIADRNFPERNLTGRRKPAGTSMVTYPGSLASSRGSRSK